MVSWSQPIPIPQLAWVSGRPVVSGPASTPLLWLIDTLPCSGKGVNPLESPFSFSSADALASLVLALRTTSHNGVEHLIRWYHATPLAVKPHLVYNGREAERGGHACQI